MAFRALGFAELFDLAFDLAWLFAFALAVALGAERSVAADFGAGFKMVLGRVGCHVVAQYVFLKDFRVFNSGLDN